MAVALCCCVKNENRYLQEWIKYYRGLGVSKFFIYDNNDISGEDPKEVLEDYPEVEVIDYRGISTPQLVAFQDCYFRHGKEFSWIAYFDIDEFFTFNGDSGFTSLPGFLETIKPEFSYVVANWMVFGDCGWVQSRSDYKTVLEGFPDPLSFDIQGSYNFPENFHVKSIVRGGFPYVQWENPYAPSLNSCCDCSGEWTNAGGYPFKTINFDVAYIRHYVTKSTEEFRDKISKGVALGVDPGLEERIKYYFKLNNWTQEKEDILRKKEITT